MKKIIIVGLLMLFNLSVNAQWTQLNGPVGGEITSLCGTGNYVFAGSIYGSLYASPFNGVFWNYAGSGIPVGSLILSTAVSGNALLAATETYLYRSTDNGQTWNTTALNAATNGFRHVALIDTILFASTYYNGVYRSTDDGLTWTYSGAGMTHYVRSFVKQGSTLFAGTWNGGIYRSINNGVSWNPCNNGFTQATCISLAADSNYVFAGTFNGVYVSDDGGNSWTLFNAWLPNSQVNALLIKGGYIFAGTTNGVYKYDLSNGLTGTGVPCLNGHTWNSTDCFYTDGTRILAGGYGGVYVTYNDGITWSESNTGLVVSTVNDMLQAGSHLWASTKLGVYDSPNGGTTWNSVNVGNALALPHLIFQAGPNLLVPTHFYQFNELVVSSDSGTTWTPASGLSSTTYVNCIESNGTYQILGTVADGFFISSNNGLSWFPGASSISGLYVLDIAISGSDGFAGVNPTGSTPTGLFYSANGGLAWSPAPGMTFNTVTCVEVDSNVVIIGAYPNVYISTNLGFTWSIVNGLPANFSATDFIIEGNTIIISGSEGVFVTNDLGLSSIQFNGGLLSKNVLRLYRQGNRIYAGTRAAGMYYSDVLLTGMEAINGANPGVHIYPNPNNGQPLHIEIGTQANDQELTVEIYSASGKLVHSSRLGNYEHTIHLQNINAGLYTLRVTGASFTSCEKLLITAN